MLENGLFPCVMFAMSRKLNVPYCMWRMRTLSRKPPTARILARFFFCSSVRVAADFVMPVHSSNTGRQFIERHSRLGRQAPPDRILRLARTGQVLAVILIDRA